VKRYSIKDRRSKINVSQTGSVYRKGGTFLDFMNTLPGTLAAGDIREVAEAIVRARNADRPVVLAMGAHPIKVGLSPVIVDFIRNGIITAIATNGAAIIHDFELSYVGMTSEDVGPELSGGTFGMAMETGSMINRAINNGVQKGLGLGESMGMYIHNGKEFSHRDWSIFGNAYGKKIPATVHVAIGTDIIHMHPEADGALIGEGTMRDFKLLASVVSDLEGGVFLNLGSAVIIPEVFLKALTIARNLGNKVDNITTVTLDFLRQYRAMENVCKRPTLTGGKFYFITGHHEINLPLLAAIIKEKLS
jgi:deoxyhypusine synthase